MSCPEEVAIQAPPLFLSSSPSSVARSTRGASKQRRDLINVEIQKVRELLPLSDAMKERLFQLQVMSLACVYIRKERYKETILRDQLRQSSSAVPLSSSSMSPSSTESSNALRCFFILVSEDGRLLYLSENTSDFLGHSVEEIVCQGDSLFDILDPRDEPEVKKHLHRLKQKPSERAFITRLSLSRNAKRHFHFDRFWLVLGRSAPLLWNGDSVLAASVSPLLNGENVSSVAAGNPDVTASALLADLRFVDVDGLLCQHLSLPRCELLSRSLYGLVHPGDVVELQKKHAQLCESLEERFWCLCLLRLERADGSFVSAHTLLTTRGSQRQSLHGDQRSPRPAIYATFQIVTSVEAAALRSSHFLYTQRPTRSPSQLPLERPISPSSPPFHFSSLPNSAPLLLPFLSNPPPRPQVHHSEQINVEIPWKSSLSLPSSTLFTPEHSSPESAASFVSPPSCLSHLPAGRVQPPLPELGGQLDDFFKQVEYSSTSSVCSSSPPPPHPLPLPPGFHLPLLAFQEPPPSITLNST